MKKYLYALFLLFCIPYVQAQASSDEYVLKKEWKSFSSKYPSLTAFSSEEIAALADQWGKQVATILSVSDSIRNIDSVVIDKLIFLLQEDNPRIFMRHGEQNRTDAASSYSRAEN